MLKKVIRTKHKLSDCYMCGPMIICGTCGNNCCNGSFGPVPGTDMSCKDCPNAYDVQKAYFADPASVKFEN